MKGTALKFSGSTFLPAKLDLASLAFSFVICTGAILIVIFGLASSVGNSFVTGAITAILFTTIIAATFPQSLSPKLPDVAFVILVASVVMSFLLNRKPYDPRECALLTATFIAYPVGRCLPLKAVPVISEMLFWVSAVIVLFASIVTSITLSTWGDEGRPFVFGFPSAVTLFSILLGYLIICFANAEPNKWRDRLSIALIFFATFIFMASMVRFTLIAGAVLVAISLALYWNKPRFKLVAFLAAMYLLAIGSGLLVRPESTQFFIGHFASAVNYVPKIKTSSAPPGLPSAAAPQVSTSLPNPAREVEDSKTAECFKHLESENSLTIRKAILADSMKYAESAGAFGFGLDAYSEMGCVRGFSPHNDLLQTTIEFGWTAGIAFMVFTLVPMYSVFARRHESRDTRFVLMLCIFIFMLGSVYGRISRDIPLFIATGLAVSAFSPQLRWRGAA